MVAVLGANSVSGVYEVSNSLRFNDDDSARLSRTPSSEGNRKTWSYSTWFKRGNLKSSGTMNFISAGAQSGTNGTGIQTNNDTIRIIHDDGTPFFTFQSSQVLRDVSAWYHLLVTCDTTDATASERIKFYLNGNNITSDMSYTNGSAPSQNSNLRINDDEGHNIGARSHHNDNFFDGYMAETHLIDGTVKAPTDFGEFDDNGVWIPKQYTGTYGTNGFFLEFQQTGTSQNSSGIGADTSGNDNHFAVTNLAATDVTEDTCTNNFATLVPTLNMTLSEGNVKAMTSRTSYWDGVHASIGLTSGKWYFETKVSNASGTFRVKSGIVGNPETFTILYNGQGTSADPLDVLSNTYPSYGKGVWLSHWYDQNYDTSSTASAQSSGDILQFALDMDNYKMWIGVNGQFKDNSNNNVSYSDVASGSSATVTIASAAYTGKTFFPDVWLRDDDGSFDNVAEINFGNPSFSISSGNTDGKYGNFEYAPPSGYYALCTKRLAEFG